MDHTTFVSDRLAHQQAATLDRELELRRRILDKGVTVAPARPELSPIDVLGIWLRNLRGSVRIRLSY
jgi:hypothetical protein